MEQFGDFVFIVIGPTIIVTSIVWNIIRLEREVEDIRDHLNALHDWNKSQNEWIGNTQKWAEEMYEYVNSLSNGQPDIINRPSQDDL